MRCGLTLSRRPSRAFLTRTPLCWTSLWSYSTRTEWSRRRRAPPERSCRCSCLTFPRVLEGSCRFTSSRCVTDRSGLWSGIRHSIDGLLTQRVLCTCTCRCVASLIFRRNVFDCTTTRSLYQCVFLFWTFALFSTAPAGLFSRSRLRGTQGPACTPRRKFGSRAGSVARALGVQSREIWQVITGSLSAELEPSKATENPHVRRFAPHCCNSSPLCGSHGTAAVAHETLPFVTATDGASVCVRACLCHVCFLSTSGIVNTSK